MSGIGRSGMVLALAVAAGAGIAAEAFRLRPVGVAYADGKGTALRAPEGVGCGPDGLLAVADTGNGRVVVYEVRDEEIVPRTDFALPELPYPLRVRVESKGDLLVLDGRLRKVGRVSARGEFRGYVEPAGTQGIAATRGFKIDGRGDVALLDVAGARVLFLGADGRPGREIRFPDACGFFSDLAVDGKGTVFLLDGVGRRLFTAGPDDKAVRPRPAALPDGVDFASSIEADGAGRLFLVDQNGGAIVILDADGSMLGRQSMMGWREGQLRYPASICLDGKGLLFVADRGNNRVQAFSVGR